MDIQKKNRDLLKIIMFMMNNDMIMNVGLVASMEGLNQESS